MRPQGAKPAQDCIPLIPMPYSHADPESRYGYRPSKDAYLFPGQPAPAEGAWDKGLVSPEGRNSNDNPDNNHSPASCRATGACGAGGNIFAITRDSTKCPFSWDMSLSQVGEAGKKRQHHSQDMYIPLPGVKENFPALLDSKKGPKNSRHMPIPPELYSRVGGMGVMFLCQCSARPATGCL